MDASHYGPFAAVIAIAAALVATFSMLVLKAIGRISRWAWLVDNPPSFLITAGVRALAVALIALTFVLINRDNYLAFIVTAVITGLLTFLFIARFDYLRKVHIHPVPVVDRHGAQAVDSKGNPIFKNILIGAEEDIRPEMKAKLDEARKQNPALSITALLGGVAVGGETYKPEALWTTPYLAKISNRITIILMGIVLCGVMTLYLAASVVEVTTRTP